MSSTILVAEDDPSILISIEFLLRNAGYQVLTANDGARAWHAFETRQAALVVLDIMLPTVDGLALCRRIRASDGQQPKVLMLSARGLESDIEKGLQIGADAYLRKPFGTHEFLQTVARLLTPLHSQ